MNPKRRIKRPIFIVGCNNSGTTILRDALLLHPELGGPEREGQLLDGLPERFNKPLLCAWRLWASKILRIGRTSMLDIHARTETDVTGNDAFHLDAVYSQTLDKEKRFIEKSPINTIRTRYLQTVYPDASFVAIVRSPIAVAEGICRKKKQIGNYRIGSLYLAVNHWKSANKRLLSDAFQLQRFMLISYDELVRDPAQTLKKIFRFVNLDPDLCPYYPDFSTNLDNVKRSRLSTLKRSFITAGATPIAGYLNFEQDSLSPKLTTALQFVGTLSASLAALRILCVTKTFKKS